MNLVAETIDLKASLFRLRAELMAVAIADIRKQLPALAQR